MADINTIDRRNETSEIASNVINTTDNVLKERDTQEAFKAAATNAIMNDPVLSQNKDIQALFA